MLPKVFKFSSSWDAWEPSKYTFWRQLQWLLRQMNALAYPNKFCPSNLICHCFWGGRISEVLEHKVYLGYFMRDFFMLWLYKWCQVESPMKYVIGFWFWLTLCSDSSRAIKWRIYIPDTGDKFNRFFFLKLLNPSTETFI